jgi:hypothetical protein
MSIILPRPPVEIPILEIKTGIMPIVWQKFFRDLYSKTGSASAGLAPDTAKYIIQTTDAGLSNAQVLASLSSGFVKVATTTGVLSSTGNVKIQAADLADTAVTPATYTVNGNNIFTVDQQGRLTSASNVSVASLIAYKKNSGAVVSTRGTLNVIEGSNITLTLADDGGGSKTDLTITSTANVVGPGSSTDNAITRYDGTTGKLLQDSYAQVSDDGSITTSINTGACAGGVSAYHWMMLTADYTLTSTTSVQKAFNTTTNGTLTLPTGVYMFDCFLYLTTMSATSGNAAFSLAGTAVTDRFGYYASGVDDSSPLGALSRTGSGSVTNASATSIVVAGTGTGMITKISGMFRVSTGGTIIPSLALVTAAAAVVKSGSWFRIAKIGDSSETYKGAWT